MLTQNVKLMFFMLIILAVALEVVADILFKKWAIESRNILLAVGFAIYLAGTLFWAFSLKYEGLSKAISVFTVLNMVLLVLAGLVIFKEDLSIANKLGIALGISSIILMEI